MIDLDLTFSKIPYGTHQTPWDMKVLLYKGAAGIQRDKVDEQIEQSKLGLLQTERLPLVISFHELLSSYMSRGRSVFTIISYLEILWIFFAWADKFNAPLTEGEIVNTFKLWTESIIERIQVGKDIKPHVAYKHASRIANLIAQTLKYPGKNPGGTLLRFTRMRKPNKKKMVIGTQADKQNLADTFKFGQVLTDVCNVLDLDTVRGQLPIFVPIKGDKPLVVAGNLMNIELDPKTISHPTTRQRVEQSRAPLPQDAGLLDKHKRSGILNLRIEAELLIFIAQTGMNLTQAANLHRENYGWQTNGDDLEVFRVFKGRRSGEAVFRCFKAYRDHLRRYLIWLNDTGLSANDNRLFPLVSRGIIRASGSRPTFTSIKTACKKIEMSFIGAQALRKTRVNWLLRRSRDPNLTAEQVAHDKETLLRDYEQPHHQSAAAEIVQFHISTDPTFSPPGPGVCVDSHHNPEIVGNLPPEAPKPDCVSPDGCLFCIHHRDVMNPDYCWKLTSHAQIKVLEVSLYKPPQNEESHPGHHVIDRIQEKLNAIAKGSEVRVQWVLEARDSVRAGRYHPMWEGHIKLLETFT